MQEQKCEICGKTFYPTPMWVYKDIELGKSKKYFCSWTCFRKRQTKRSKRTWR